MPLVVGTLEAIERAGATDVKHMGTYHWTIPNYSSYALKRLIHSPTFEKGGEIWKMWLFPKGSTHATEGDMSLFLHYSKEEDVFTTSPLEHPSAKFSIKIIDQAQGDGIRHQINEFHNFGESNGEWGWKDFAQISRLTEEDSGLITNDQMKVELNLYVRPKKGDSAESSVHSGSCQPVELSVLTDGKIKSELNRHASGLVSFKNCKSYCFCNELHMSKFLTIVSRDVGLPKEQLRFWLCEEQPSNQLRIVKNLTNKTLKLQKVSDVAELWNDCVARVGRPSSPCSINIFVEMPPQGRQALSKLNTEEDWIAFLKYYDPIKGEVKYLGTIPLRRNCTPVDLLTEAQSLAGMKPDAKTVMFVERPVSSFLMYKIKKDDDLDAVGVRPGSSLIIQPEVDPAKTNEKEESKQMSFDCFLEEVVLRETREQSQTSPSRERENQAP